MCIQTNRPRPQYTSSGGTSSGDESDGLLRRGVDLTGSHASRPTYTQRKPEFPSGSICTSDDLLSVFRVMRAVWSFQLKHCVTLLAVEIMSESVQKKIVNSQPVTQNQLNVMTAKNGLRQLRRTVEVRNVEEYKAAMYRYLEWPSSTSSLLSFSFLNNIFRLTCQNFLSYFWSSTIF